MKKKNIPYALLTTRIISFIPIILSTFNVLSITLLSQILLTTVIMTSDIFDGKISRKYNNEKDKLRFRIMDTITDKTGIFLCLIGLLITKKISPTFATTIIGYNSILLTGGAINLAKTKNKEEKTVQGLSISRLFTALTGISIILLNNVSLNSILSILLTTSMASLGVASLSIQLKDKIKQKNITNINIEKDDDEKTIDKKEENKLQNEIKKNKIYNYNIDSKALEKEYVRKRTK